MQLLIPSKLFRLVHRPPSYELPEEILEQIIKDVANRGDGHVQEDLYHLIQVSQACYRIAHPLLFQVINVRGWESRGAAALLTMVERRPDLAQRTTKISFLDAVLEDLVWSQWTPEFTEVVRKAITAHSAFLITTPYRPMLISDLVPCLILERMSNLRSLELLYSTRQGREWSRLGIPPFHNLNCTQHTGSLGRVLSNLPHLSKLSITSEDGFHMSRLSHLLKTKIYLLDLLQSQNLRELELNNVFDHFLCEEFLDEFLSRSPDLRLITWNLRFDKRFLARLPPEQIESRIEELLAALHGHVQELHLRISSACLSQPRLFFDLSTSSLRHLTLPTAIFDHDQGWIILISGVITPIRVPLPATLETIRFYGNFTKEQLSETCLQRFNDLLCHLAWGRAANLHNLKRITVHKVVRICAMSYEYLGIEYPSIQWTGKAEDDFRAIFASRGVEFICETLCGKPKRASAKARSPFANQLLREGDDYGGLMKGSEVEEEQWDKMDIDEDEAWEITAQMNNLHI
ncbi:hypothetical protein NA57DRAFT_77026 [Rhizodiscina lignyota]|uniref:Uncharacterized protein n=1 Tax=Rhizodiscina lignyota TaxID=1504668 RepID=A0A9P4ICE3_9PEZI|nr:hypothetical protein NA57DRAFT_77026 [Rhizodiscina lignyota]